MLKDFVVLFLPIIIGYIVGSFLPGYFIPKWFKKRNIFDLGDHNPGTINIKNNFGFSYAFVTFIIDFSKGLLTMFIAKYVFHSPLHIINITGLFAIIGHIFPFYLNFRGGRGVATAVGIFLFLIIKTGIHDFDIKEVLLIGIILFLYLLIIFFTNRNFDLYAVTFIPFLMIFILLRVNTLEDKGLLIVCLFLIYKQAIFNFTNNKE